MELVDDAKPLTVGEFKRLMGMAPPQQPSAKQSDLFKEVSDHGHSYVIPDKLQ
ncbi:hypothetical protein [Paenibacillus sp. YYML68]|uniref:hypothetical protein n=1 Tax=Paenibacillus sp. YYML68 TaxID=2909250 RepID=UPI002492D08D|nr:hypothetical protein [Paenibacillus sp. YYML68]